MGVGRAASVTAQHLAALLALGAVSTTATRQMVALAAPGAHRRRMLLQPWAVAGTVMHTRAGAVPLAARKTARALVKWDKRTTVQSAQRTSMGCHALRPHVGCLVLFAVVVQRASATMRSKEGTRLQLTCRKLHERGAALLLGSHGHLCATNGCSQVCTKALAADRAKPRGIML